MIIQQFDVQLTFRQMYSDSRLAFSRPKNDVVDDDNDVVTLVGDEMNRLWMPDTFIRNSRAESVLSLFKKEQMARVKSNGDVRMSTR